jgi:hypothetical protein
MKAEPCEVTNTVRTVGHAANHMMSAFATAMHELEKRPPDSKKAQALVEAVADALDGFTNSVHCEVETLRRRFWTWANRSRPKRGTG